MPHLTLISNKASNLYPVMYSQIKKHPFNFKHNTTAK